MGISERRPTDLETPEQIATRRRAHRTAWQRAVCTDCGALIGQPCQQVQVPRLEMLAGLAHADRIRTASRILWP